MANYDIVPASGFDHCAACNKKITKKAYKPKRSGLG
jgi:recombinational DNA repair protein (RecF pathway)